MAVRGNVSAADYIGAPGFTALRRKLLSNGYLLLNLTHGWQCLQVVVRLHNQPRRGIATKVLAKPSSRVSCDGAAFLDDLVDAGGRDTKRDRKGVHAETKRSQVVFAQNLTRMYRAHTINQTSHADSLSGNPLFRR